MIKVVEGKNICLRLVDTPDAEFILSLRLDADLNKYISATDNDVEKQREWIRRSWSDEKEYYFIIEGKNKEPYGTVRIYDYKDDSFSWGSWIIRKDAPMYASIESALLVYESGFHKLGFKRSHFEVIKDNIKVVSFHKGFGATIVSEDQDKYYFTYEKDAFAAIKQKYKKYLPEQILFVE